MPRRGDEISPEQYHTGMSYNDMEHSAKFQATSNAFRVHLDRVRGGGADDETSRGQQSPRVLGKKSLNVVENEENKVSMLFLGFIMHFRLVPTPPWHPSDGWVV